LPIEESLENGAHQLLPRLEVKIDRPFRDAGALSDIGHRQIASARPQLGRRAQDRGASLRFILATPRSLLHGSDLGYAP